MFTTREIMPASKRCFNCNRRLHGHNKMACSNGCDPSLITVKRLSRIVFAASVLVTLAVAAGMAIMTVMVLT